MIDKKSNKGVTLIVLVTVIIIMVILLVLSINAIIEEKNTTMNTNNTPSIEDIEIKKFLETATLAYNEIYGEKIADESGEEIIISLAEIYAKLVNPNGNYQKTVIKKKTGEITGISPSVSTVNIVNGMDGRNKAVVTIDSEETPFTYYAEIEGKYYEMKLNDSKISLGEELNELPEEELSELTAVSKDEAIAKVSVENNIVTIEAVSTVNASTTIDLTYKSLETSITVNVKPSYLVEFETNGGSWLISQKVADEEHATQPENPIKENQEFEGWYIDPELTTLYDFNSKVTSDMKIYAKYKNAKI